MNYIDNNNLGSQLKPVRNNRELEKAIFGRKNCVIYTIGTFEIEKSNLMVLESKNIKLIGLAFAQAQFKPRKKKKKITKPLNIVLDEFHELPLNVSIGIDMNLEQKDRHISGGMH